MANKKRPSSKKPHKLAKKWLLASVFVVVIVAVSLWGAVIHDHATPSKLVTSSSQATTTSPNSPSSLTKIPVSSPGISQGTATPATAPVNPSTSPQQWATSQSGNITIKEPVANATFSSGDILAGSATVSQVEYRLIDNQVGQIAEGPINVVNGNFSASLEFTPHATGGQLDVFSYAPNTGVEINEVQIPVNF